MVSMAYVEVLNGPEVGKKASITQETFFLGRDANNHLVLSDRTVSRKHAVINKVEGNFMVSDLKSLKGLLVNGSKMDEALLEDGDEIAVGAVRVRFHLREDQSVSFARKKSKTKQFIASISLLGVLLVWGGLYHYRGGIKGWLFSPTVDVSEIRRQYEQGVESFNTRQDTDAAQKAWLKVLELDPNKTTVFAKKAAKLLESVGEKYFGGGPQPIIEEGTSPCRGERPRRTMAEESTSQEKTEDATPKRLREARKKGQVAKSRDLNTVVILVAAFALLAYMVSFFYQEFRELFLQSITFTSYTTIEQGSISQFLRTTFWTYVKITFPYMLVLSMIALAVGFFQVGPIFSPEPVKPQTKRLNIVENVKNMFKVTTLVELAKNILKISLIFYFAYVVIQSHLSQILLTVTSDLPQSTRVAGEVLTSFLMKVFVVFTLIAILDIMVQRWQYKKQLRMTKEEVKREYKQDEGDPIMKSVRKQLHQELAMSDTKKQVAASDVVVTNPTELAIAIKYDEKEMMAPQIMAKGQRWFAEKIREFADEGKVPIVRNVPLAWSLIELEIGQEIPEELYQALAEILVIVYRMREQRSP